MFLIRAVSSGREQSHQPCWGWGTWSDQPFQGCVWQWEEEARSVSSPKQTHSLAYNHPDNLPFHHLKWLQIKLVLIWDIPPAETTIWLIKTQHVRCLWCRGGVRIQSRSCPRVPCQWGRFRQLLDWGAWGGDGAPRISAKLLNYQSSSWLHSVFTVKQQHHRLDV